MPDHTTPFVHSRRITWGQTDVARIAYTARFLEFAMDALEAWWNERMGIGWYEMNVDDDVGTPFVHTEIDYRSPVTPRDTLGSAVTLIKRGNSSLTFSVVGRVGERLVYEAKLVCVIVQASAFKPIPAPKEWEAAFAAELALGTAQLSPTPAISLAG